jgi:GT2 family glycosyltransferase
VLLSVVLVNWNSRDDLEACLDSLRAQTHRELEVILVDNGSTDGSVELVRERYPEVVLLAETENLGFAEGCNRGIDRASGEWVALLNNDAVAEPGWAAAMVEAAVKAPPRCGMLQSVMFFLDRPDTFNSLGLFLTRTGGAIDRCEHETKRDVADEEIFCPTGGAAAYRRAMLDEIRLPTGWLDREYFMYSEDFDLGWRAQLAGWTGLLVGRAFVRHKFHGSTARRGRAWFVEMTRINRLRTLLKNASPRFLVETAPWTLYELAELAWVSGPRAVAKLPRAVAESLRQRRNVTERACESRRTIERRWVGRR